MDVLSSADVTPRPIRSAICRGYWPLLAAASGNRPYLQLIKQVIHIEGDLIECGVVGGRRLLRTAAFVNIVTPEKTLHGLGNFERDVEVGPAPGTFRPGRHVLNFLARVFGRRDSRHRIVGLASDLHANLKLYAGYFEETLSQVGEGPFCFVHLDCGVYDSYLTCLETLYDRVVPGGIILIDDYQSPDWPGATRAADEFFANRVESLQRCDDPDRPENPKYFVVKQPAAAMAKAA